VLAAVIMAVQGAIAAVIGLAFWVVANGPRRRFARRFFDSRFANHPRLAGLVFIVIAIILIGLAVAVGSRRRWAHIPTFVVEGLLAVASVLRFHPLRSLVGLLLAVAVIVLVAVSPSPP
jgi:ABC-type uncharacterized transport system permease subunit